MAKKTEYDPARHMQALCCDCGMLRHLNRKYYTSQNPEHDGFTYWPTNGYSIIGENDGNSGYWAYTQKREPRMQSMVSRFDRYVCLADCENCQRRTRHAMIYPADLAERDCGVVRDSCERAMHEQGIGEPIEE